MRAEGTPLIWLSPLYLAPTLPVWRDKWTSDLVYRRETRCKYKYTPNILTVGKMIFGFRLSCVLFSIFSTDFPPLSPTLYLMSPSLSCSATSRSILARTQPGVARTIILHPLLLLLDLVLPFLCFLKSSRSVERSDASNVTCLFGVIDCHISFRRFKTFLQMVCKIWQMDGDLYEALVVLV